MANLLNFVEVPELGHAKHKHTAWKSTWESCQTMLLKRSLSSQPFSNLLVDFYLFGVIANGEEIDSQVQHSCDLVGEMPSPLGKSQGFFPQFDRFSILAMDPVQTRKIVEDIGKAGIIIDFSGQRFGATYPLPPFFMSSQRQKGGPHVEAQVNFLLNPGPFAG